MQPYLGLLLDLDGTLADTEPQHCAAWLEMLAEELDLRYDEQWFGQWIGTSDRVVADWLIEKHGLLQTVDEMIEAKKDRFHLMVRESGRSFPGVTARLSSLHQRFPMAIATNSGRADTEVVVPALGLDRYVKTVVTATDVANLKPAPDIYLLAAGRLGLDPAKCIAIEDSAPGGLAAKAAGCYLIGLNEGVSGADEVISDNAAALDRAAVLLG